MSEKDQRSENPGSLPIYLQIAEQISREISAGHLIDGQRLPPEREMAASYGVAVRTLRKSLARLTDLGLLTRRQGSGNYIRKTENAASIYSFFRLELPLGGGLPTAQFLSVETLEKPADLPSFGQASFGHRFRRLRFVDQKPAALEEIWLDGSVTNTLKTQHLSQSLYQFYKEQLGLWITHAEDWVGLAPVPAWTCKPFPIKAGETAGFFERFGWSQQGIKVEYSRNWFDPCSVNYVARIK